MKKLIVLLALFLPLLTFSQHMEMNEYNYDQELLNKEGQRHGSLVFTNYIDDSVAYLHKYNNGKLLKTTDYRFQIESKKELIGIYKNDLPFEGYFVYENEFEIPEVDYYEKGVFKKKYTTTILAILETEMTRQKPFLVECIYKDDQIWRGLRHKSFKLGDATLLATEYYDNGAITTVDLWALAIHHAELIKLKFLPNGYEIYKEAITDPEGDPQIDNRATSILTQMRNSQNGTVSFSVEGKVVGQYQYKKQVVSKEMHMDPGILIYTLTDDNIIILTTKFNFESFISEDEENDYNPNLMMKIYGNLMYKSVPIFHANQQNDYTEILKTNEDIMQKTLLFTNKEGVPIMGYLIEKEDDHYKYSQYQDSKIISKSDKLTFKEIKKLFFQY